MNRKQRGGKGGKEGGREGRKGGRATPQLIMNQLILLQMMDQVAMATDAVLAPPPELEDDASPSQNGASVAW